MRKGKLGSIFLILGILAKQLTAQSVTDLDPVTITSTITPVQASKTGRDIMVINGNQLSKQPVHSIDELLKYLPGIEVQQRGPMGAQSDIVVRGGTFEQALVVLDGIRLNDPLTGHFSSYIPIAMEEIDRIEIMKGAASAIYGTEAVGGVIHIITKSFSHKNNKQANFQAGTMIGQFGLWGSQAGGIWSDGKNTICGGVNSNNASGQAQRGINGYFNNTTASVSFSRKISEHWQMDLRTAMDNRSFAAQNFYTTYSSDTAFEKVKSTWSQAQFIYTKGKQRLSLNTGFKTSNDNYVFNKKTPANINNANLFQTILLYEQEINKTAKLSTGVQFIQKNISSNNRGDHHVPQAGAFLVWNQTIAKYWFINPAIRYDYNSRYGSQIVPQLNGSFKKENIQLRGAIGKTIRDADFTELYNNYGAALVAAGSVGNPNLVAEKGWNYEIGADYWVKKHLKISAGIFYRNQHDLIDWVTTPYANMPRKTNLSPTGTFALAENIATVNVGGLELSAQYAKSWKDQSLWATVGLQSLQTSGTDVKSFYVNSAAKFLANFNLHYQFKQASIMINGVYKERSAQAASGINAAISPNYFVMNIKLQYALIKNKLSVFAEADNAFDTKYSDLLGSKMPGRWVMGGFMLEL